MLFGLRHNSLIGRNHKQSYVDSTRAREHRSNERFMAWHIDDANRPHSVGYERRKSKIDCDAATLFFRETIGVNTGQCTDERCLAVIDMARGAEYHAAVQAPCSQTR